MSEKQEGELYEKILQFERKFWVPAANLDDSYKDAHAKDIFKILDEAKQDFPDVGELSNLTLSRFEIAVLEWKKKWLGDAEEKEG